MLELSLAVQHISHEGGRSSLKVLSIDYIEVGQCSVSIIQNKEMFTFLRAVKYYTQHTFHCFHYSRKFSVKQFNIS